MSDREITTVEFEPGVAYDTCNNCGAYAESGRKIKHYPSCKPDESRRWERYYEEANNAEQA